MSCRKVPVVLCLAHLILTGQVATDDELLGADIVQAAFLRLGAVDRAALKLVIEADTRGWGWAGDQATKQTMGGLVIWNCTAISRWDPDAVTQFGRGAPMAQTVSVREAPYEDGKTSSQWSIASLELLGVVWALLCHVNTDNTGHALLEAFKVLVRGLGPNWREQALAVQSGCACHQLEVEAVHARSRPDPGKVVEGFFWGVWEVFKYKQYGIIWRKAQPDFSINKVFGTWNQTTWKPPPEPCTNKWDMYRPFLLWLEEALKNGLRAFVEHLRNIWRAAGNNLDEDGETLKREGHAAKMDKIAAQLGDFTTQVPYCTLIRNNTHEK